MATLQHVLAATDFSAPARHAAERAATLAHATGATLDLVHVADEPPPDALRQLVAGLPEELPARWRAESEGALHALAATLGRRFRVAPRVHLASGSVPRAIAQVADAVAADAIVLGARGSSFVRHLVLGSTAERLIAGCTRPMLVVRQIVHEPYRSALVAVDFSAASAPALAAAAAIAPQARLRIVHAFEAAFEGKLRTAGVRERLLRAYRLGAEREANARMAALRAAAAPAVAAADTLVIHGGAVARILEQEQENDCDLVVVGKLGASRMEDAFLGSVARRIVADAQADVLVVPAPRAAPPAGRRDGDPPETRRAAG